MTPAQAKKQFYDNVELQDFVVVGECTNDHGELYVVYTLRGNTTKFVTGDELDWEAGWQYQGGALAKIFHLTEAEQKSLAKFI